MVNLEEYNDQNQGNSLSYIPDNNADSSLILNREQHAHEQTLDKQSKEFQLEMQKRQFDHEKDMVSQRLGWIGKLWGEGENSSRNIAALLCGLMLFGVTAASITIYCVNQDKELIASIWKLAFPFMTLALGYIFGKNN